MVFPLSPIPNVSLFFGFYKPFHYLYESSKTHNKVLSSPQNICGHLHLSSQVSTKKKKMVIMNEFSYEELDESTEKFSSSRLIGKGSHGCVYKGLLKDGKHVAVKKLSLGLQKLQDNSKLENEITILSSLPRNSFLVNVIGTSHDSVKNRVMVMELMSNGTLHDLLHVANSPPSWPKRIEMAIQIARAVHFLHEANPKIIHRDVKSANVLLDLNWNARLGDFGLAVRLNDKTREVDSPSQPAGTIGYLDPCYTTPSKLSTKIDVFSFGVVLLEIISCTKAFDVSRDPASVVEWAIPLIKENRVVEICDKRIVLPTYIEDAIQHILHLAARCVSPNEDCRPSMKDIVLEMESCFTKRVRFPIWMKFLNSLIKRQRKIIRRQVNTATTTTKTTIVCATHHVNVEKDISRGKLLLREVLADIMH